MAELDWGRPGNPTGEGNFNFSDMRGGYGGQAIGGNVYGPPSFYNEPAQNNTSPGTNPFGIGVPGSANSQFVNSLQNQNSPAVGASQFGGDQNNWRPYGIDTSGLSARGLAQQQYTPYSGPTPQELQGAAGGAGSDFARSQHIANLLGPGGLAAPNLRNHFSSALRIPSILNSGGPQQIVQNALQRVRESLAGFNGGAGVLDDPRVANLINSESQYWQNFLSNGGRVDPTQSAYGPPQQQAPAPAPQAPQPQVTPQQQPQNSFNINQQYPQQNPLMNMLMSLFQGGGNRMANTRPTQIFQNPQMAGGINYGLLNNPDSVIGRIMAGRNPDTQEARLPNPQMMVDPVEAMGNGGGNPATSMFSNAMNPFMQLMMGMGGTGMGQPQQQPATNNTTNLLQMLAPQRTSRFAAYGY